jgi:hypothetical protein
MDTAQAQALTMEMKKSGGIDLETGDRVTRQLKRLPKLQSGKFSVRIVRTWGFEQRRFDRLIDYLADPFPTGLESVEGFTPGVIAEYFYRCAEIHEDGEWRPVELALRRPVSA